MPLIGAATDLQNTTGIVNVSQAAAPSANQVLTATSATAATWQTPGASSAPLVALAVANFEQIARYNAGGGNVPTIAAGSGAYLNTTATINTASTLRWDVSQANNNDPWIGNPQCSYRFKFASQGTDFIFICGIGLPTFTGTGYTNTQKFVGFQVKRAASGAINLIAFQADGTTNNSSSTLTTVAIDDNMELISVSNGTTSCDYYWRKNGGALSAKTTLTGNMPSGTGSIAFGPVFFLNNDNHASQTEIIVSSASYQR